MILCQKIRSEELNRLFGRGFVLEQRLMMCFVNVALIIGVAYLAGFALSVLAASCLPTLWC